MFTEEKIAKMRACLDLLPEPGGEVVEECLDEIERLRYEVAGLLGLNERLQEYFDKYACHKNDEYAFCDKLMHSNYPCTCGFDDAQQELGNTIDVGSLQERIAGRKYNAEENRMTILRAMLIKQTAD